jgi:hypothetical protein
VPELDEEHDPPFTVQVVGGTNVPLLVPWNPTVALAPVARDPFQSAFVSV